MSGEGISREEAARLIATGEWVPQDTLRERYENSALEFLADLAATGRLTPEQTQLAAMRLPVPIALVSTAGTTSLERRAVEQPESVIGDAHLGALVGRNLIVKIGPTLDEIKWSTLALVCGFLSLSTFDTVAGLLLLGRSIKDVRTVFVALTNSWERVTDPVERAVLESVCRLHASLSVTNHDALQRGHLDEAFGSLAPTEEDIREDIRTLAGHRDQEPPPSDEQISAALQALRERHVLAQRGGRWSVII